VKSGNSRVRKPLSLGKNSSRVREAADQKGTGASWRTRDGPIKKLKSMGIKMRGENNKGKGKKRSSSGK